MKVEAPPNLSSGQNLQSILCIVFPGGCGNEFDHMICGNFFLYTVAVSSVSVIFDLSVLCTTLAIIIF